MHIFIEILPLLLGGLIGTVLPARLGSPGQKATWVGLGLLAAGFANFLSGEGLLFLPVDLLLVSVSAFFVFRVRQYFVSS